MMYSTSLKIIFETTVVLLFLMHTMIIYVTAVWGRQDVFSFYEFMLIILENDNYVLNFFNIIESLLSLINIKATDFVHFSLFGF